MSTFAFARNRANQFLRQSDANVFCISGRWGTGKTYAWREILHSAIASGAVPPTAYSYVSLFGIDSLSGLKNAILENIEYRAKEGGGTIHDVIAGKKIGTAAPVLQGLANLVSNAAGLGNTDKGVGSLLFGAVRNQIVCIDDIERRGENLRIQDVLGLTTFLKEERNCKVVLILNSDQLGSSEAEFSVAAEKAIDAKIVLEPTPEEAFAIAVKGDNGALREKTVQLGINNIRIVRKIAATMSQISEQTSGLEQPVLNDLAKRLAIIGWAHYRSEGAPPISFLRRFRDVQLRRNFGSGGDDGDTLPEHEIAWVDQLEAAGFGLFDELDETLLAVVQTGILDPEKIAGDVVPTQRTLKTAEAHSALRLAWDAYHDGFKENHNEVVSLFREATLKHISAISTWDLFQVLGILSELKEAETAQELLRSFEDSECVGLPRDLRTDDAPRAIHDETLLDQIEEVFTRLREASQPRKSLRELVNQRQIDSWSPEENEAIAAHTRSDFKEMFRSLGGGDLRHAVSVCLQARRLHDPSDDMVLIAAKAEQALEEIAGESLINAVRLRRFNIVPRAEKDVQ